MAWSGNVGSFSGDFGTQKRWPDGTRVQNNYQNPPNSSGVGDSAACNDGGEIQLKNITPNAANAVIIGLVISKQQPKTIPSKSDPNNDRGLISFTIRDSPMDFINGTCWGSENYIFDLASKFKIGDIVEIRNPQIQNKQNTEQEERYRPWTPSPYQLSLSEKYSSLSLYGGWNLDRFNTLQHVPIRGNDNYYTLADVLSNGQGLHGEHINLLALLKTIGPPKDIVTKAGKKMQRCEVKLYDETCPSFPIVLWDTENIELVQRWMTHETVVFAFDIMVKFDNFRSSMVGTVDSKTIFIINPDTQKAHSLFKFGQSHDPSDDTTGDADKQNVDLSTIKDVYKVDQIKSLTGESHDGVEYGITYAFLTALDIDNGTRNGISMRCASCKRRVQVDSANFGCINPNCPSSLSGKTDTVMTFDIPVDLSDITGTLSGCYLGGNQAEEMLKCSMDEFIQYTDQQKTDLKWKYLLERCKVYFKVSQPGAKRVVRVLSCSKADPMEVIPHL
ncbi:meiosis-specific with OB domain-containing protein-like [Asterias amurensis]|uniref:meiosis-specific with OB domain-containing protein-like n=1 Tax=Asterias amurensis TaxID=7602 RepID=UPI003AB8FAA5